jgi:hypothetical protein
MTPHLHLCVPHPAMGLLQVTDDLQRLTTGMMYHAPRRFSSRSHNNST